MRSTTRPSVVLALLLTLGLVGTPVAADHPLTGDVLRLSDPHRASRRLVLFRAARDPALVSAPIDDPRTSGASLALSGSAPGDGTTGTIALAPAGWHGLGDPPGSRGFVFTTRSGSAGIRRVLLRPGSAGGTLAVSGHGPAWPYAILQPQGAIDVRLAVGSEVYCARFTTLAENRRGRVVARDGPAPPDCTGVATCSDGVVGPDEECDDGNLTSGDGCSAACRLEDSSALCAGVPTASGATLRAVTVASGLTKPTYVTAPPLDPSRVFVVEQPGRIRVIRNGALLPMPFLAIEDLVGSGGERGLLSVAFHPHYATNRRFFVYYNDTAGDVVIARYQATADPDVADASSGVIVLTISHQLHGNHNGGQLAFGPDDYLYAGTGDGGGSGDPEGSGQSDATLLGKLLRLDVDVETPPYYAVPSTNPFVGPGDPRDEIWAKGLRNPWRFSFDRGTGDLYIGDVGQDTWEEVDVQPAASPGGDNYGWNVFEGRHCFSPSTGCVDSGFVMPVLEYDHDVGCSVTGGFVYRGCAMPDLRGTYFYSDYCTSFVRTFHGVSAGLAQSEGDRTTELTTDSGVTIHHIPSFGEDARGELYFVDRVEPAGSGSVFRIVPGS
jgi:cysteine-rich repeat protein